MTNKVTILTLLLMVAICSTAAASLTIANNPNEVNARYTFYQFTASGTGCTETIPYNGAILKAQRIPYAVEWIDGTTAPSYPLTLVMTSGAWTLTWTLTSSDKYQFYSEASGDSSSPPTISGDVTVTITADGESSGSLGSGDGTLRLIFW